MRIKLLKYSRVAISLVFLVVTGFLFLDFAGTFSSSLINGVTWIQFVPSLIKFLNLAGFLTLGFLVVLVATIFFGRIYCSTVCPLGILQDVFSRISRFYKEKILRKKLRYRSAPAWNRLRFSLLGVTVITFLFGSVFLLNLLDPFSLFGKIFSGLARPLYFGLNNMAADILIARGDYSLYHVQTRQLNFLPLLFPALMLGLVAFLSFSKGRLYCNTVCPVGSFLGLISKYSMYRIEIDQVICNSCNKCSLNCKAQCIDIKNNEIDFSRCVGCFNCLNVCSEHGIDYQNQWFKTKRTRKDEDLDSVIASLKDADPEPEAETETETDDGRRSFLFRVLAYLVGFSAASRIVHAETRGALVDLRFAHADTRTARSDTIPDARGPDIRDDLDVIVTKPSTIPEDKQFPISPPGSGGHDHFTSACTACQLCVSACPSRVLQPSFLEYGFTGMMLPRMDYHASFCNFDCVICTEICPTGAILPLTMEEKHLEQIGIVKLELDNCVVQTENTACGACAEHCPTQAVRMVPWKYGLTIPEIEVDHCIGCGACEYICPTRPYRAIYVDGNQVHIEAIPPVIEELDYVPDDDFPF